MNPVKKSRKTRRSFLKAALGCAAALCVPVRLSSEPEVKLCSWYKPGIWAVPKGTNIDLLDSSVVVLRTDGVVFLRFDGGMWKETKWKDGRSSRRFSERSPRSPVPVKR